jgi:hypothetical protein
MVISVLKIPFLRLDLMNNYKNEQVRFEQILTQIKNCKPIPGRVKVECARLRANPVNPVIKC